MIMRYQKEKSIVTSVMMLTIMTGGLLALNPSNSVYADDQAEVNCKDHAVALISWDGLYAYIDNDDITDLEDDFGDDPNNDVDPSSFDDIIDDHMEDMLDDYEDDNCDRHISDDNEDWIEDDVDFER